MTSDTPLPPLISESWTTGFSLVPALHVPISAAQCELLTASASEKFARALWDVIVARLGEWKWKHGSPQTALNPMDSWRRMRGLE